MENIFLNDIFNSKKRLKTNISKKRLLIQYLRLLPAKLGLINKAAFLLQIKRINSDDTFLVSYAKSGSTWVSFVIAYMKTGTKRMLTFNEMEQIVPVVYTSQDLIDSQKSDRIIKSHHILFDYYPRMIYVYRDYRDVLVSYYHYQLSLKYFSGTFQEFIRSKTNLEYEGSWKNHVKGAMVYNEKHPEDCILISYESLIINFKENALKIAKFCKLNIKEIDFAQLEEKTNFRALKENETTHGSPFMEKTKSSFMREGKIGSWKDMFTQEDLNYLYSDNELVSIMQTLGYLNTFNPFNSL